MRRRCRIITDPITVWNFAALHDYPGLPDIDALSNCLMVEITLDGEPVAYMWLEHAEDGMVAPHLCASSDHPRTFLDSALVRELHYIAYLVGGDVAVVSLDPFPPNFQRRMACLLKRHGWELSPGLLGRTHIYTKDIRDTRYG